MTQKAAARHLQALQPGLSRNMEPFCFFRCWNFTLLLFISIPLIRNPELNSLHACCTLPLAGLPRLSLANPGVNRLIPWTGVREALEQLVHSLARLRCGGWDSLCVFLDSASYPFHRLVQATCSLHSFGRRGVGNDLTAQLL